MARANTGHRVGGVRLDKIMDEIRKLQSTEAPERLVPRVAFARLVQDTMTKILKERYGDRALVSNEVSSSGFIAPCSIG